MSNKRILVVEDEGVTAMNLESTLQALGYEVVGSVVSGEEAVRQALDLLPDLILMDITLDGPMNGMQAAAEINKTHAIPIIYLTAHNDNATLDQAKRTEPFAFLPKPCTKNTIVAAIEMALYRSEAEAARKKAEEEHREALYQSEEKYRTVANFTHDWEFWIGPDGSCRYCSPSCEQVSGHACAEFKDNPSLQRQLVHPDDLAVYDQHRQAAQFGEKCDGLEYRILRADGQTRWVSHVCQPVYDSKGQFAGTRGSNRDITRTISLQAEVMKARNLEALGVLAGGIAHDFNNLLQGLLGNISLALMFTPESSEVFQYLKNAEQAYDQAMKLTAQFVAFSAGGLSARMDLQPAELIRETVSTELSSPETVVEFDLADDLHLVKVDPGLFRQVIKHLTTNACEAMPAGGKLRVAAVNETLSSEVAEDSALAAGNYVKISFKDQGCGISAENLSRIFDPYFSTKNRGSQRGTGLGLSLCNTIIQKHGGTITVASKLGQGSTFHIRLPAVNGESLVLSKEADGQGRRLLIMDDDLTVLDVATRFLEYSGYRVDSAVDGNAAIKAFQEARAAGDPYALVILDLIIPSGVGGLEVFAILKELEPRVKAVVSSGYVDDPVMANFADYGFVEAFKKPYRLQAMKKMLEHLI